MEKTLFLDRDGVINIDAGHSHIIEEMEFIDGIFGLCRVARSLGYQIIIITNQAGIAKGYYDEPRFVAVMEWMLAQFKRRGIDICDYYFCPHHVDGLGNYRKECHRRKPEPGMIMDACVDHDVDLGHSIIIGDKISDMVAGQKAGIATRLLFNPDEQEQKKTIDNIRIFFELSDITQYLKKLSSEIQD